MPQISTLEDITYADSSETLEQKLRRALQEYDAEMIGELPIDERKYKILKAIAKGIRSGDNHLPFERVPYVLFVATAVFFARYTEQDTRTFWKPYLEEFWKLQDCDAQLLSYYQTR